MNTLVLDKILYFLSRNGPAARVDSPRTGWKNTQDGSDADEKAAPLGSWHKEEWAERQTREHVGGILDLGEVSQFPLRFYYSLLLKKLSDSKFKWLVFL